MQFNNLSPMLYTSDIEESVNFYTQQLGFACKTLEPEWGWASVQLGTIRIMFSRPNAHTYFEHPFFTGSFYFNMEDVDTLWEKLKDTATVCYPIEDFEYGMREFAIYDNNGYLLQFGQELKPEGENVRE
ncbi:MAG TPA: VOC family protein [Saprospiraceae bacterium]|nr:VOC family protein [Saprospiraceae bacterium]